jgi:hypothetical protein
MWFTETPWPPAIILLVAAVLCGVAWNRNRKPLYFALAAVCLVAIPLVFVIEQAIVTPGEEVELQIAALREAVVADDLERTLSFFSKSAVLERTLVTSGMSIVRVNPDVHVTDVSVQTMAENTQAVSHLRANGTFVGRGAASIGGERHFPTRWRVSWRKEAGEWKIYGLERLDPITGERIGILSAE